MGTQTSERFLKPTSTQTGQIAEASLASGLILASGGRLAPFRPFADDDGIDLLIYDKATRRSVPVQVKARTGLDNDRAGTVQFDVRLATFAAEGAGFIAAVLMDGATVQLAWLIPTEEFGDVARSGKDKLVMVASTKPGSSDRYRAWRHHDMTSLAGALIDHFENGTD
ncbi:hypothetical protein FHS78_003811 [Parvibaculum indicum]|uniref:DUF4365 domain-containing protein n=1 Tax=Parvibaculum indicum TaxID=562969 RepID=UPI0014236F7C|nr:DUF4365 domain-containing protein [Parvibaculum indicum]NIJ43496.1 hypothetical protein [Parvibaculum indicum]